MGYMRDKINQLASSLRTHANSPLVSEGGHLNRLASRRVFLRQQEKAGLRDTESRFKALTSTLAVFALAFVVALIVSSTFETTDNTGAADNEDTSTASADGYTLSVSTTSSVDLNITVSENDTMTIRQGNITVSTTSPGYKLFMSMLSDNTNLSSTNVSGVIAATSGTFSSPSALTRGTWGYAIPSGTSHIASNGFNATYTEMSSEAATNTPTFAVPPVASSSPQLIASSSTATSGDNFPIYYAVRANADTNPGAYSNSLAFTAVADAGTTEAMTITPSTIDPDTATTITVATTMYSTATSLDATVTMTDATSSTTLSCTKTTSTPLTYSCNIPASSAGTYTITASIPSYGKSYNAPLEVASPIPTLFSIATMQEMTTEICANATTPLASATQEDNDGSHHGDDSFIPTVTLVDDRTDGESGAKHSYKIKKLADGRCWMVQNLALVGPFTPSTNDSDVESNSDFTLTSSNTNEWCKSYDASCNDQSMVINTGTTYGVLYNWYAATAGTGTYIPTSDDAKSSICPKGWRLPMEDDYGGEFNDLYTSYGSSVINMFSETGPNITLSGMRLGGNTNNQGDRGYYWSSTTSINSRGTANNHFINNSSSYLTINNGFYGFSVRCIVGDLPLDKIHTMQEITLGVVAATTVGTSNTLTDIRDGNTYNVKKLEDGKIWMTQNLRLEDKSISDSDSNLRPGATFTVPPSSTDRWCSRSNSTNCDGTANVINANNDEHPEYGTYYNWFAATAGEGTYSKRSGNTYYSICPKGWHLPTGGSSGEFQTLYSKYDSSALMQDDPAFALSGYRLNENTSDQGDYGYYWSSTAYNYYTAYNMYLGRSSVSSADYGAKYRGYSVRCVSGPLRAS